MKLLTALLFIVTVVLVRPMYAQDLTIYTEEFPPYNFTEAGETTGVSTEVLKLVLNSAGFTATIKSLPWNQAFSLAQKQPDALIYSITHNKNREKMFKWIGVLTPVTKSVYAMKSRKDIKIGKMSDLKRYKIGTNIDDVMEIYLLGKGFSLSDFERVGGKNATLKNFKRLLNNHIDVLPAPDPVAYYIVRRQGHSNPDILLQKVFALEEQSGGYYLAASLSTSDAVVERLANALNKVKQTGAYYNILAHWGVDAATSKPAASIAKLLYSLRYFKRIVKVGYLASDKRSAHREGGVFRMEMRENFVEQYVKTFDQWRAKFIEMQDQVDALIIGTHKDISGWNASGAKSVVLAQTRIPTGTVIKGLTDYALIGYEDDAMVINKTVADRLELDIPKSYLRRAARVIQ